MQSEKIAATWVSFADWRDNRPRQCCLDSHDYHDHHLLLVVLHTDCCLLLPYPEVVIHPSMPSEADVC